MHGKLRTLEPSPWSLVAGGSRGWDFRKQPKAPKYPSCLRKSAAMSPCIAGQTFGPTNHSCLSKSWGKGVQGLVK